MQPPERRHNSIARSTAQSECGELSTGTKISRYTGTSASGSCRAYTTLAPSPGRVRSYRQYGWCMLDCNGGETPGQNHGFRPPAPRLGGAPGPFKTSPGAGFVFAETQGPR